MAALGILLIGIGSYLMYDALKNASPAPITNAQKALQNASGKGSAADVAPAGAAAGPEPSTVFTQPFGAGGPTI